MSPYRPLSQTIDPSMQPNASRTPPPSPKKAPPSSPSKRRRFLKESDDSAGELLIEEYIYRTDPYRSTSVTFPYPTPLSYELADDAVLQRLNNDSELRSDIASTLRQHNIERQSINVYKQSKPGYTAGGDIPVTIVHIAIDVEDNSATDAWSAGRRDVKALLIERGFEDLEVELIDPERFYMPSLFPVFPNDPCVKLYEGRRGEILDILQDTLAHAWTSVSLFKVGRTSQSVQHAIVVMVNPLTKHDWVVLRWRIESIMNKQDSPLAKVNVEFMPGKWGYLLPKSEETGGISFADTFKPLPHLGTSIGVEGESGGGSLGGFFKLACHGREHTGFLTNSHVTQPTETFRENVIKEYHWFGCGYLSSKNHPARSNISYFAAKDVSATRTAVEEQLQAGARRIKDLEQQLCEREALENPLGNLLLSKTEIENNQHELQTMRSVLMDMPRRLGQLLCASGRAVTDTNQILDWAFVEIPREIQAKFNVGHGNLLPQGNAPGLLGNHPKEYGCSAEYISGLKNFPIQGFSKVEKGEWYYKVGRASGITTGICNGTETHFNLNGAPVHVLHDKAGTVQRMVKMDKNTVNELVVLNSKSAHHMAFRQNSFCRAGDSGSLLIDAKGYIAGLIFGSLTGQCGPIDDGGRYVEAGLVSDINTVKASIAARTTKTASKGQPTEVPGELSLAQI